MKVLASNEVSILDEKSAEGVRNFALNNTKLFIKKQVVSFKCDVCDHELNIADLNGLEGASCINFRCNGHYHLLLKDEAENYYRQVYNRSRSPRIYATEHTGLLERADREMKEFQFKQRPFFNSLNALVATSTLEMGINIKNIESFSADMEDFMSVENEIGYDKINFEDLNLQTARVKDLMKLEFLFN